jgi:hypothetical protein
VEEDFGSVKSEMGGNKGDANLGAVAMERRILKVEQHSIGAYSDCGLALDEFCNLTLEI